MAANQNMLTEYLANNQRALEVLQKDHQVKLRAFPPEVLAEFKVYAHDVLSELSEVSELSARIYQSYQTFAEQTNRWLEVSELSYLQAR